MLGRYKETLPLQGQAFALQKEILGEKHVTVDEEEVISFCEFYKETTEVKTMDELLAVCRNGVSVLQMWNSLSENDTWVY